ncbi:hypothetical protein [Sulfobacillus harzensis]|uniref:hypothetical protein n=1 Tax=Sulfobacillus harzensis TaxID=2729629 RepID=UPI001A9AAD87|nr:hypothetical protein [Sulfobacillus harzensis]
MRHNRVASTVRMALGSAIGVMGFARLSLGFVHLNGPEMLMGIVQILVGTFLTIGVMAPLRHARRQSKGPDEPRTGKPDSGTP